MLTCAILPLVSDDFTRDDPRFTAHKMPMAMATETLQDIISSADALQKAIIADFPLEQQRKIREVAMAQAESYLDLMAEAARHARVLKP